MDRYTRHNFGCFLAEYILFGMGVAFFSIATVLPSFLDRLGAPIIVIGLLATLQSTSWLLPQLLVARYLAHAPSKKPYLVWPIVIGRVTILAWAVAIWTIAARPAWLAIGVTLAATIIFWATNGLSHVAWFDLLGKLLPGSRQGRLITAGQALSSVGAFGVGFVVEWMLSAGGPAFPTNYASLFVAGAGLMIASCVALELLRETPGQSAYQALGWREFVPRLWGLLKDNRAYRRYLLTRQVYVLLTALTGPFYMVYALERLGLPVQVAGRYTSIGVLGSIVASALFGWISERYGSREIIWVSAWVHTIIPAFALASPWLIRDPTWLAWGFGLVFFLYSFINMSGIPGWATYALRLAPETERPTYIGLTNTLIGVTAMIFTVVGGAILQWSGNNYTLLFAIGAVGLLLALPLTPALPQPQ